MWHLPSLVPIEKVSIYWRTTHINCTKGAISFYLLAHVTYHETNLSFLKIRYFDLRFVKILLFSCRKPSKKSNVFSFGTTFLAFQMRETLVTNEIFCTRLHILGQIRGPDLTLYLTSDHDVTSICAQLVIDCVIISDHVRGDRNS